MLSENFVPCQSKNLFWEQKFHSIFFSKDGWKEVATKQTGLKKWKKVGQNQPSMFYVYVDHGTGKLSALIVKSCSKLELLTLIHSCGHGARIGTGVLTNDGPNLQPIGNVHNRQRGNLFSSYLQFLFIFIFTTLLIITIKTSKWGWLD